MSFIDNTFATPLIQRASQFRNRYNVMHSATKYFGGHSDICAGAVAASTEHIDNYLESLKKYGW